MPRKERKGKKKVPMPRRKNSLHPSSSNVEKFMEIEPICGIRLMNALISNSNNRNVYSEKTKKKISKKR